MDTAYEELTALLDSSEYNFHRVAIIPDELWYRLKDEVKNPLGSSYSDSPTDKPALMLWYKGWTVVYPESKVLNCCKQ